MSNEKTKVKMDPKYILTLTVTLFVTCVIVAGLLGGVNAITADRIAAINWEKTQEAMKAVVEDKESTFSDALAITPEMEAAAKAYSGSKVTEVYEVQSGGAVAGYAMKIEASGSQGTIEMMVGVDTEGAVTGVSVVTHKETAGIGSKVMENELVDGTTGVLDQFQGKSTADGELIVNTNVTPISGATVSSKGVTAGVNAALAVAGAMA